MSPTTAFENERIHIMAGQGFSPSNIARSVGATTEQVMEVLGIEPEADEQDGEDPEQATIKKDEMADVVGLPEVEDPDEEEGNVWPANWYVVDSDMVVANPYQTRQDEQGGEALQALADDIEQNGLLQPPMARMMWRSSAQPDAVQLSPENYEPDQIEYWLQDRGTLIQLVFGHRRVAALRLLGNTVIPMILRPASDWDMARQAWSENAQRVDISPIEQARAIKSMVSQFGTQEQIAASIGLSRAAVANKMRLLQLPADAQQKIARGDLSEKHGRTILRILPLGAEEIDKFVELSERVSTRQLDTAIDNRIKELPPILDSMDEPVLVEGRWGGPEETTADFPVEWDPLTDPTMVALLGQDAIAGGVMDDVLGPCEDCPYMAKFGGESHHRCARPIPQGRSSMDTCHGHKSAWWDQVAIIGEKQMVEEATGYEVVDFVHGEMEWFGSQNTPAELLPEIYSNSLMAVYAQFPGDDYVRVAPEVSDRICWACNDLHHLEGKVAEYWARVASQEPQDGQEEEIEGDGEDDAQIAAQEAGEEADEAVRQYRRQSLQARQQIEAYFDGLEDAAELWSMPTFQDAILHKCGVRYDDELDPTMMASELFWSLARHEAQQYVSHPVGHVWRPDLVSAWLNMIASQEDDDDGQPTE